MANNKRKLKKNKKEEEEHLSTWKNIKPQKTEDQQQLNTSTIEGDHRYSGHANDFNLNCQDNPNQSINQS